MASKQAPKNNVFADLLNPTKKKDNEKNEIFNLLKVPKKDNRDNTPRLQAYSANSHQQADLLFLPNDKGKKYALVVVDVGSRKTDAVPLTSKTAAKVKEGFQTIYDKHNILKMPKRMDVDDGNEFKGAVSKYFKEKKVFLKHGKPGRHRSAALAENRNKIIGRLIMTKQTMEEDKTGKTNREWVKDLPDIVEAMNDKYKEDPSKKPIPDKIEGTGSALKLIPLGTQVRAIKEKPTTLYGEGLHGNFRAGDLRWERRIRTVININLTPGYPPTYELDNPVDHIKYTKGQIQIVPADEKH